jgi:hypothetical protein
MKKNRVQLLLALAFLSHDRIASAAAPADSDRSSWAVSIGLGAGQAYLGETMGYKNFGTSLSAVLAFRSQLVESIALAAEVQGTTSGFHGPPFFGEDSYVVPSAGNNGTIWTMTPSILGYWTHQSGPLFLAAGLGLGATWERIDIPNVEGSYVYATATLPSFVVTYRIAEQLALGLEARLMFTDLGSFLDGVLTEFVPRTAGEDTCVFVYLRAEFLGYGTDERARDREEARSF